MAVLQFLLRMSTCLFHFWCLVLALAAVVTCKIIDPFLLFEHHELLRPKLFDSSLNEIAPDQVPCDRIRFLRLLKNNQPFISVRLVHNRDLLSPDFFVQFQKNGKNVLHRPNPNVQNDCHFTGELLNLDFNYFDNPLQGGERIVINAHDGKLDGLLEIGGKDYYLHFDTNRTAHVLFSGLKESFSNKSENQTSSLSNAELHRSKRSIPKHSAAIKGFYNDTGDKRYLELIIVNDHQEYLDYEKNQTNLIERNKQIANFINSYYVQVNIYIVLVGVVIWNERNEVHINDNSGMVLENFLQYRKDRLVQQHPNDNAQLISGVAFANGTVGKALLGPVCSYESSGGINSDHVPLAALVASTVAHELGHNFGLQHDNSSCKCPETKCIMADSSSRFRPKHWSDCSLQAFQDAFNRGMDSCMRNKPSQDLYAFCGNGILEEGEQCDCGQGAECLEQKCCDMQTCKLTNGSYCGTGICCDFNTCSSLPKAGKICRPKADQCDFDEFCNGFDEFCPTDLHFQDGSKCNLENEDSFCYDGLCRTKQSQCKLLWGHTAKVANATCYKQNVGGTLAANCGAVKNPHAKPDTYLKCSIEDIYCGRLHCNHDADGLKYGWLGSANQLQIRLGSVVMCSSAIIDLGLEVKDPGLVPNGVKCGENKMCVNQHCVSVTGSICENDCHGNGVCRSDGYCSCNDGYYPPYCKHSFGSRLLLAIYIIFLGVLPTLGLIAGLFLYYREHLKTWWIVKSRKAIIKNRVKQSRTRGSVRSQSLQRNIKFNVDLKRVEISQPIPINADCSINNNGNLSQPMDHEIRNFEDIDLRMTSPVTESVKMKPIRPAPAPPPKPKRPPPPPKPIR